jgi:hypothetical protein
MAGSSSEIINALIAEAKQALTDFKLIDRDVNEKRALIKFEGQWQKYRLVISEVHRPDGTRRYTYYVLNRNNKHIHRFDNAGDKKAIKLRYGPNWKSHQHTEIPHQHNAHGQITLTEVMTFETFIQWLKDNLTD